MRRIGYKLPLRRLGLLQAVGELIELGGERCIFVVAAHLDFVAVFALADKAHGHEDLAHALGADDRENRRACDNAAEQDPRPAQNVPLEVFDDLALLRVEVHHVHAADRRCTRHDRNRCEALQRARVIRAVEHVAPAQRLHDRLQKRILPHGVLPDGRIVEHLRLAVGDKEPADVDIAKNRNNLIDRLRAECVRRFKRRRNDLNFVLHRGVFGLKHQLARVARRIDIQKHQRKRRDHHIRQRISQLRAVGKQTKMPFRT